MKDRLLFKTQSSLLFLIVYYIASLIESQGPDTSFSFVNALKNLELFSVIVHSLNRVSIVLEFTSTAFVVTVSPKLSTNPRVSDVKYFIIDLIWFIV